MTIGVALEFVLQGGDIVHPHLLGYFVGDALSVGYAAHDGLVARQRVDHRHRTARGMIGARGGIVMGAYIAA